MSKYELYEQKKSKLENELMSGQITPEQFDTKIKELAKECGI